MRLIYYTALVLSCIIICKALIKQIKLKDAEMVSKLEELYGKDI
jgi:hypothetical protein